MIRRIDFSDIKNTPIGYLGGIDFFNKNKSITFKSGINVIVGLNGCGKTTLLNLIRRYTLCLTNMTSTCPSGNMEFIKLLFSDDDKICDGIKVISDYQGVVFNMLDYKVLEEGSNCLQSASKFNTYINMLNCSTGEGISSGLDSLFNIMFDPKTNLEFPIKKLKEIAINKYSPAQSKAKAEQLLQYYRENSFQYDNPKDFEFTVLMDEPDRNLDINRIKEVYNILSQEKENTQIIAVVHNPVLIYRLSKSKNVNIIEMTEGYVEDVVKFVENTK
jgi:energy-coupling factor transporter ATP-binding protein EcfA2|nr:MAG TPA: Rad50 [Crassvirales sp.]